MERSKFIAIFGVDGTGKSTTVETLVQELNNKGIPAVDFDKEYSKQPNPFSERKKQVLESGTVKEQFIHFLDSNSYQADKIREMMRNGTTVVKDRWYWDIIGHHRHLGIKDTGEVARLYNLLHPDLSVLLTLNEEERLRRVNSRPENDERDFDTERSSFLRDFLYQNINTSVQNGDGVIIDTGDKTPEVVVEHILQLIL